MATVRRLALVKETARVDLKDVVRVAAALQKQALSDFAPVWKRPATVDAFAGLEDVPTDYWPMVVRDDIPYDAQGIHLDDQYGPFSLIRWDAGWSLTASHECLEMLADPYGRRMRTGPSPRPAQGDVQFLASGQTPREFTDGATHIPRAVLTPRRASAYPALVQQQRRRQAGRLGGHPVDQGRQHHVMGRRQVVRGHPEPGLSHGEPCCTVRPPAPGGPWRYPPETSGCRPASA